MSSFGCVEEESRVARKTRYRMRKRVPSFSAPFTVRGIISGAMPIMNLYHVATAVMGVMRGLAPAIMRKSIASLCHIPVWLTAINAKGMSGPNPATRYAMDSAVDSTPYETKPAGRAPKKRLPHVTPWHTI